MPTTDKTELTSWKEIASYLRVTVRTAQLWEAKSGLPVRRLPGTRGRVLALTAELDAWKHAGRAPKNGASGAVPGARSLEAVPRHWRRRAGYGALALIVIVAMLAVLWPSVSRNAPSGFRIERDTLVILDGLGKELWRRSFGRDLHDSSYSPGIGEDLVQIVDFNDDGENEVLFAERFTCTDCENSRLYYFSSSGDVKWWFSPGRELRTASGDVQPNTFDISKLLVARFGRSKQKAVLFVATHKSDVSCQVGLVSVGGDLVREYWHAGHIGNWGNAAVVGDPDGDGVSLLYLSGCSNPRGAATLVVLDPDTMGGASQEDDPHYQLVGFGPGNERVRIFFPRSSVNEACGGLYNRGRQITLRNGFIGVETHEDFNIKMIAAIRYSINPVDFSVYQVSFDDSYLFVHKQLRAERKLAHDHNDTEEAARLLQGIKKIERNQ